MIAGLDRLFLEVNSLEESLAFYHEVIGFEIESQNPGADPPLASLRSGDLHITLVQQLETMLKRGRGVYFVMRVQDVDLFHRNISARGASVSEPKDEGWGGRFVSLQDPDGYQLFFIEYQQMEEL
jgi:predicted enzyme related to lactoylglutathione lyase